jgi:Bacterial pullanase-associated domain
MKKLTVSLMTFVLFIFISTTTASAFDAPVACTDSQKTVTFHYLRFDGQYDNVGLHVFDTAGTTDTIAKSGTDDFGAYFDICIGNMTANSDGEYIIGALPLADISLGNDRWSTKDWFNTAVDFKLNITDLFVDPETEEAYAADAPTKMDVYFLEGGDSYLPIIPQEDVNQILVVYADENGRYENWGIHTWNTGTSGSAPAWGSPVPFEATGYTSEFSFPIKLAALSVGDDAAETIGFIVTDGTDKAYATDIFLPTADAKANGTDVVFYLSGQDGPEDTQEAFMTVADTYKFVFKFEPFDVDAMAGTYALGPNVIQVVFNQDVRIFKNVEVDGEKTEEQVFNPDWFTLTVEGSDTPIGIEIGYVPNVELVTEFVITFTDENYVLDPTKTYTLAYDNGETDVLKEQKAEIEVDLDTEAPEIILVSGSVYEINQYDPFEFPDFAARDNRDGQITQKVYVPSGKGILNTANAGDQKITLAVEDEWGHSTELEFTVRVKAATVDTPTDDDKEDKDSNTGLIIGIIVGAVVVVGGAGIVLASKKK